MLTKEVLKQVIEEQRKKILNKERGVTRKKLNYLKIVNSSALVLSGIRRCGKSTLLRQLLNKEKNFYYLNLEDVKLNGFELKDFVRVDEIFKELYGKEGIYFFDEIQNVEKWELFIRNLVDDKRKVVVTGSNASLLSQELGTRLTGRHKRQELFPFSYEEFLKFKKLKPEEDSYREYLFSGGFPEYLKSNDEDYLNEILNDIVMRDIVVRYGIKNPDTLKKIAIYLISNVGKEFSYNSLKKMFKLGSVHSIINFVSYFKNSYLLFTIPKFSYSYKKQQVSPKKVYCIDNGLSGANSVSFSKDLGRMLENQVFLELRKNYKEIFYFQEENECDFVVKEKEEITKAIQVCYDFNEDNMQREVDGLLSALNKFKLKQGLILTFNQDDELEIDGKKIIVKPVWKWMTGDEIS